MKILDMSVWCSCEDLAEYKLIKEDWHAERKDLQCERCGHKIHIEFSLQSSGGKTK